MYYPWVTPLHLGVTKEQTQFLFQSRQVLRLQATGQKHDGPVAMNNESSDCSEHVRRKIGEAIDRSIGIHENAEELAPWFHQIPVAVQ